SDTLLGRRHRHVQNRQPRQEQQERVEQRRATHRPRIGQGGFAGRENRLRTGHRASSRVGVDRIKARVAADAAGISWGSVIPVRLESLTDSLAGVLFYTGASSSESIKRR